MRKFILLLAFFTLTTESLAVEKTGLFAIQNMTCALCPFTVHKPMATVSGVKIATIDFRKKQATVIFDDGATTPASIAEASTNSGYPATLIQVTP
jgi:mercuric ion binding protein